MGTFRKSVLFLGFVFIFGLGVRSVAAQEADPESATDKSKSSSSESPADSNDEEAKKENASESEDGSKSDEDESAEAESSEGDESSKLGEAESSSSKKPRPTPPKTVPSPDSTTQKPGESKGDGARKEGDGGGSPISDLAADSKKKEKTFEGVEPVEGELADRFVPSEVYPQVEWHGLFRTRTTAAMNFDLDTRGTSAMLPPAETYRQSLSDPIDGDKEARWSTDMLMRLQPDFHITEYLTLHTEVDLLQNTVLGSLYRDKLNLSSSGAPDPSRHVAGATQASPEEQTGGYDSIRINEAFGEAKFFFGRVRAGRMDNDWGLGIYANGGDCPDCNYGDHVDRLEFATKIWKLNAAFALDYPWEGLTDRQVGDRSQSYDLSQIDEVNQYTFRLSKRPTTKAERKEETKKLREDKEAVINGGVYVSFRNQTGDFVLSDSRNAGQLTYGADAKNLPRLVFRGEQLYIPDAWFKYLYNPNSTTYARFELELTGVLGDIDNVTNKQVSQFEDGEKVNCFNDDVREGRRQECTTTNETNPQSTNRDIRQLGGALESEFYFGGPFRFGLNGGYASGDDMPRWGYGSSASDFYRFDPNYHVDLILFRDVIGTVTNAYYANPWVKTKFLESGNSWMEFQLDAIGSRSSNPDGAPSDDSKWLGLEFDGALRFIQKQRFQAELLAGILFPFDGLNAEPGNRRLRQYGSLESTFDKSHDASIAWTLQGNMYWKF